MGIKNKRLGPKPIQLTEYHWQELAKSHAKLPEAARTYLTEMRTNNLTDAFREVRKYHAEHSAKMRDFEVRR